MVFSEELKIPQLDGAMDSPTKKTSTKRDMVKTIPRSPKSAKKYAPLDIVISKSPAVSTMDVSSIDRKKFQLKV